MEIIFRVIWATICAWVTVWFIGWLNTRWGILDNGVCHLMMDSIRNIDWSPKKVLFFTMFLVYLLTPLGKNMGNWLFILLTIAIAIVVIIVAIVALLAILTWIAGTL